jgi:hypothetical protein
MPVSETMSADHAGSALTILARTHPAVALALRTHLDALEADNAALLKALREHGRTTRCPRCFGIGSRTCPECDGGEVAPYVVEVAAILKRPHPGDALLAEHAKALRRARNEGLEKAAEHLRGTTPEAACFSRDILAMKEPEE